MALGLGLGVTRLPIMSSGALGGTDDFIMTVRTTTPSESFTIPTTGTGYNYDIDWGDGNTSTGQTGNASNTYAVAGDYEVKISGTFPRIYFNNAGDKAKVIEVKNLGKVGWSGFASGSFHGCINMTSFTAGNTDFSGIISLTSYLNSCISLTSINLNGLDTSSVGSIINAFFECSLANIVGLGSLDISSVTNISNALYNCDGFDESLASWDITSVTSATSFMTNATGLSTANYDATLIGWEATLQAAYPAGAGYGATINISFGGSKYTLGGAAETARTSLINTFGWTITDGGGV